MARMKEITCKCGCGRKKMVRTADLRRGWGKFYSKSCKAKEQEGRTHQYRNYLNSGVTREKYLRYANEYGGVPQFNSKGEYEGFTSGYFDNCEHQNSGD
jgi:hypothetical protein